MNCTPMAARNKPRIRVAMSSPVLPSHFVNPATGEQHRPGASGKNEDHDREPECFGAALRLAGVEDDTW